MPLIPLKIPPGIVRLGTEYQAKGRWTDSQLVRWVQGVLQPWLGWETLTTVGGNAVSAWIYDDGTTLNDQTADANDAGPSDFTVNPVSGETIYIGFEWPFESVEVSVTQSGAPVAGDFDLEYWDGTSWVEIPFAGLYPLGASLVAGVHTASMTWEAPLDWETTTVNAQGPFYYVRVTPGLFPITGGSVSGNQAFAGGGPVVGDGPIRGMHAWRIVASAASALAFGTFQSLFRYDAGVLTDITPGGLVTGQADASYSSGLYGSGPYGSGPYGIGAGQADVIEATAWSLDNFGEDLVACLPSDGKLWLSDSDGTSLVATQITNSNGTEGSGRDPTSCIGVVVTPERFVVALGYRGDPRLIAWSDQEDAFNWDAADPNTQGGDFPLDSAGKIQTGKRVRAETLIWTETDLYSMRFIGGEFTYSVLKMGTHCGAISRQAVAVLNGVAVWMGVNGFYSYDGFPRPLPSPVHDFVFSDLQRDQASKVVAFTRQASNEVVWHYPSGASLENDRYVAVNLLDGSWSIGELDRTAGVDQGVFAHPLAADSLGRVYLHETGSEYLDTDQATELVPFVESGPLELGEGDRIMQVDEIIPDEKSLGDVTLELRFRNYPTAAETVVQVPTLDNPTTFRASGRQVQVYAEQITPRWRIGNFRLNVRPKGRR